MFGLRRQGRTVAPALQVGCRADAAQQKQRGQQHQPGMPDHAHQQGTQYRPHQPAQARTGCQQPEQALGLLVAEQVGQYAPGQRDAQQVEHRQPDVERPGHPQVVGLHREHQGEGQQVACQKAVGPGQDPAPPGPRHHPAEQRQCQQGDDEGAGEQPLQVVDAAGHPHGLAYRSQHEIAGEQQEEQRKAAHHRRGFVVVKGEQPAQQAHQPNILISACCRAVSSNAPLPALSWSR